jgi:Haem-binding uptake, Tiki superfamily, ChaN
MASTFNLRSRRSAAQLHALEIVVREIKVSDHNGQRKYLRDFNHSFRSYRSILDSQAWNDAVCAADVVLIGDYHALPASQRWTAALFEQRALPGDRPVVLGVETIFSRDQHILDEWWRREIDEHELRQRIRYDRDWGYEWGPFYELLTAAREHGEAIYGLDCMPREDLRKIGARDRHAAHKIAEIRQRHANAVIMVLFGESHLAPKHLPRVLREQLPQQRVLTVLQNVDALYWQAAGELREVEWVRVEDDVLCVFNSTPLEKYENYRLCLGRWSCEEKELPDAGPTIYNLIDGLLRFLDINGYSSQNCAQPKFLVDLLPEIYCGPTETRLRHLLQRAIADESKIETMLQRVAEQGSVYLPAINAFYVREFHMMYAAEEAARFLHHACRGLPLLRSGQAVPTGDPVDRFYARMLEHGLAYFGSRVLYPARPAAKDKEPELTRAACEKLAQEAGGGGRARFDSSVRRLGYALGSELYLSYLAGRTSRSALRRLFLGDLEKAGEARKTCLKVLQKLRCRAKSKNRSTNSN